MYRKQTAGGYPGPGAGKDNLQNVEISPAFAELEQGVYAALETYSNVHRGSGHKSMVSEHLLDKARDIVLEHFGFRKGKYVVIFCTARRAEILKTLVKPGSFQIISSRETGLPLGVTAFAVHKKALPQGKPFQTGGGTTRLVSADRVIWGGIPEKFEGGTPSLINIIAFAKAIQLIKKFGSNAFRVDPACKTSATEILYSDELQNLSGRDLINELRKRIIGRDILVPTIYGDEHYINLDNAASTPTFTTVWDAVRKTWRLPIQVRNEIVQEVKSVCARYLNAPPEEYEMIFTSNTTEGINLVAESLPPGNIKDTDSVILNTGLEHNSNDLPWRNIPGSSLLRLNVNTEGFINIHELNTILLAYNQHRLYGNKRITLVALNGASNVLGVFNNLEEISRIVHRYGARLLIDAAQLVAHRSIRMKDNEIDYLIFSAHKAYAPFGTGMLVVRKDLLHFRTEENELIRLSGEENTAGIAALGKALILLQRIGMDIIREEEQELTRKTLNGLSQIPGIIIYGINDPDSPSFAQKGGVIVFALKNIYANIVARELAERGGIGIRYGCHCAHLLVKQLVGITPFLERFQHVMVTLFPSIRLPGLARASLGITNTDDDIDTLIYILGKIVHQRQYSRKLIYQQMKDFVATAAGKVYS